MNKFIDIKAIKGQELLYNWWHPQETSLASSYNSHIYGTQYKFHEIPSIAY